MRRLCECTYRAQDCTIIGYGIRLYGIARPDGQIPYTVRYVKDLRLFAFYRRGDVRCGVTVQ